MREYYDRQVQSRREKTRRRSMRRRVLEEEEEERDRQEPLGFLVSVYLNVVLFLHTSSRFDHEGRRISLGSAPNFCNCRQGGGW
jgi:hypothetical protein